MFRTNTDNIKILSPSGFSNFNGIQKGWKRPLSTYYLWW